MLRVFISRHKTASDLLVCALGEMYGLDTPFAVARGEWGKPWFPEAPHIRFNLSHSGGLALCAVGSARVGADIEEVRPRTKGLPRFALHPEEYRRFEDEGGSWESFYTLWTQKEAWCKYTGRGLPPRPSAVTPPGSVCMRSYAGEGWRCAVCADEPPPRLEWK